MSTNSKDPAGLWIWIRLLKQDRFQIQILLTIGSGYNLYWQLDADMVFSYGSDPDWVYSIRLRNPEIQIRTMVTGSMFERKWKGSGCFLIGTEFTVLQGRGPPQTSTGNGDQGDDDRGSNVFTSRGEKILVVQYTRVPCTRGISISKGFPNVFNLKNLNFCLSVFNCDKMGILGPSSSQDSKINKKMGNFRQLFFLICFFSRLNTTPFFLFFTILLHIPQEANTST